MAISTLSPILLEQTFLSIPTSFTLLHLTLQFKSPKLTLSGRQPGSLLQGQTQTFVHPLPCKIIRSKLQTATQDPGQLLFSFSCGPNLTQTSHTNNLWSLLNLCDNDSSSSASHSFTIGAATTGRTTGIFNRLFKF